MRFVQRSIMGLFLLSLTVGLLALAAGSVRNTLNERWSRDTAARPARERVFAVNVLEVDSVTATPKIAAFGEIRSRRTLDLRAPISGTIRYLSDNYVEGGAVEKGELLVALDPADARSALGVSKTELAEATAGQAEARAALELAGDELEAARDQAKLRNAALKRQNDLLRKAVGTEAAVETAALAQAAANQAVLAKRQAMSAAQARVSRSQTTAARAEIRVSEARRRLDNTEVFAEFGGLLSAVSVVQGGLVGPNEKIGRLIDPAALEVAFRLSNTQFGRLIAASGGSARGEVLVSLDILGLDVSAKGSIERVGAEVGAGQTGRLVFASIPATAAAGFRPGDFVAVSVSEPPLENVAILPALALDSDGNVLVLGENDRLVAQKTTVLRRQKDKAIVRAENLYGREIVEARSPLLGEGIRVKPVRRDDAAPVDTAGPELIALSPERRARLVAFVQNNAFIPANRKQQLIGRLNEDKVPANMVRRIESRMGG